MQVTKTTGSVVEWYSAMDAVDHTQDAFYVWNNPSISYTQLYKSSPTVKIRFGINGAKMNVIPITAAVLMGKEPDTFGVLATFTAADRANLLAHDPFLANPYSIDPKRFIFVQEVQLEGANQAGGGYPGTGIPIGLNTTTCVKNTVTQQNTVSFGGSAGVDFFGAGEKVEFIGSFTTKLMNSWGDCNGVTQLSITHNSTCRPVRLCTDQSRHRLRHG